MILNSLTDLKVALKVYDVLGKVVFHTSLDDENNTLDLSFLESGVYEAVFKNGEASASKKLILN